MKTLIVMKTLTISAKLIFYSTFLLLLSCEREKTGDDNPSVASVETNPPNTNYKPAFAGQTRVAAATTATKLKVELITESLNGAWEVVALPDGKLLVSVKSGDMWTVSSDGTLTGPIHDLPEVYGADQGGLMGLCLDPDFNSNRMIYWAYSEQTSEGSVTTVAKARLADDASRVQNFEVIYRATPYFTGTLHYGGRVLFDNTGNLLVSVGERSDADMRPQAQSLGSALGKIIRITKNGQPAPGNPFVGQADARAEVFTYGHRNPQGLAIHPVTGDIWQSEHGPRGGDEINRLQTGKNYGWPVITYGIEYSGAPVGAGQQQAAGMEQPVYYWDPSISPSGMTFYRGNRIAEWENNLFIGALSGRHIVRLIIENNQVVGEERLLATEEQRFRGITQGNDGALYAVTDQGRLYKIDRE